MIVHQSWYSLIDEWQRRHSMTTVTTNGAFLGWFDLPVKIGLGIAIAHIFSRILGLIGI